MADNKLIKITSNDWHYKIIKYCWDIDPSVFRNLCPYFWLTIASLFTVIPIFIYKNIKKLLTILADKIFLAMDITLNKLKDLSYERDINNFSKGEIYYLLNRDNYGISYEGRVYLPMRHRKMKQSVSTIVDDILKKTGLSAEVLSQMYKDDYKREVAQARKTVNEIKRKEVEKEQKEEQKRREAYRKRYNPTEEELKKKKQMEKFAKNISLFTKNIFIFLFIITIVIVGAILSIMLSVSFVPLVHGIVHLPWLSILKYGSIIIIGALIAFAILWYGYDYIDCFFKAFSDREEYHGYKRIILDSCYYPANGICTALYKLGYYLLYVPFYKFFFEIIMLSILNGFVEGFNEFGGIFRDYFNASYSDYCPGIDWEKDKED